MNPNGDIRVKSSALEKMENFWYHYKWRTIGLLFLTAVLTICIAQCCRREKSDVVVLYAGPYCYSGAEFDQVKEELNRVLPADYNGDGKKQTGLVTYQVMTEEQLTEYQDQVGLIDTSYFTGQSSSYSNYIMTGECTILILDENLYQKLLDAGRLRDLREVFPELPSSAIGSYGIDFTKTALYRDSEQLGRLPKGTVLCLLRPYVMGNTGKASEYANMTAMFAAMAKD